MGAVSRKNLAFFEVATMIASRNKFDPDTVPNLINNPRTEQEEKVGGIFSTIQIFFTII
jgi:hypothetical protein